MPAFVALIAATKKRNVAALIDFQKKDHETLEDLYKRKLLAKQQVLTCLQTIKYSAMGGAISGAEPDLIDWAAASRCNQSRRAAGQRQLHLLPIFRLFKRVRGAINSRFVEMLRHEHESDRQSIAQPARNRHRGMSADIELAGILDVDKGERKYLFNAQSL